MVMYSRLRGARWWTVLTVVACGATVFSTHVYFDGGPTARFLLEKGTWVAAAWWRAAFYLHVTAASFCLLAGSPLMFPAWTQRHPAWHRALGYGYFNAVLWLAAPSGLALAFTAKGGAWGTAGFAVAGVLWWYSTWSGYLAIRRGEIALHVRAMVRSYCWALSAPAFRVFQTALYIAGVEDDANYVISLWLSVAASIWLAESFLFRGQWSDSRLVAPGAPHTGVVS